MRSFFAILFVCAAAAAQDGWIALFDGKTMNHWVDPRQKTPPGDAWSIADGFKHAAESGAMSEDEAKARFFAAPFHRP